MHPSAYQPGMFLVSRVYCCLCSLCLQAELKKLGKDFTRKWLPQLLLRSLLAAWAVQLIDVHV